MVRSSKRILRGSPSYIEPHIEQGSSLTGISIGIPTGIVGIGRYAVRLTGEANHAGTTPMKERRDAMRRLRSC